jgi:hypothetical protein
MGNSFLEELYRRAAEKADELHISDKHRIPVGLVGYTDFENCIRCYDFTDIHEAIKQSTENKFYGYQLWGILQNLSEKRPRKARFSYEKYAHEAMAWWGKTS